MQIDIRLSGLLDIDILSTYDILIRIDINLSISSFKLCSVEKLLKTSFLLLILLLLLLHIVHY